MANDTSINDQILDSVTEIQKLLIDTQSLSISPSMAMLNNVMAETIGMSMHNAVTAQHNAQMLNAATTTSTCARILSVVSASAMVPATKVVVPPIVVEPVQVTVPVPEKSGGNVTESSNLIITPGTDNFRDR